jgi:hypothetical protein
MNKELHKMVRELAKKNEHPSLIVVGSQAVKNTRTASVESKGFCFYKSTNGIKRRLAVDVLGLPVFTLCTRANVTDNDGLVAMFIKKKLLH